MKMTHARFATLATALLLAACAHQPAGAATTPDAEPGAAAATREPTSLVVHSWGGIASINVLREVTRGAPARYYGYSRLTCGAACNSPMDTISGTLTAPQAERIWRAVRAAGLDTLRADYGTSSRGADLMLHEIVVTDSSGKRTFDGDDLTLPPALKALMDEVAAVLREARGTR